MLDSIFIINSRMTDHIYDAYEMDLINRWLPLHIE